MFYSRTNTQNMGDLKTKKIPFTVVQKIIKEAYTQ